MKNNGKTAGKQRHKEIIASRWVCADYLHHVWVWGGCCFETSRGAQQGLEVIAGLGNPDGTWVQSFCRTQVSSTAGERRCFRGLGLKECLFPGIFLAERNGNIVELQFFLVLHHLTKKSYGALSKCPALCSLCPCWGAGGVPGMSEKNRDGNLPLRGHILRGKQIPD